MSFYDVLGLTREATPDDIKRAYRELAKKYHPDVYGGSARIAEQRMQEINEAYRVLSDEASRAKYDASLPTEQKPPVAKEKPISGSGARRHPLERILVLLLIAVAVCAAAYLLLSARP